MDNINLNSSSATNRKQFYFFSEQQTLCGRAKTIPTLFTGISTKIITWNKMKIKRVLIQYKITSRDARLTRRKLRES